MCHNQSISPPTPNKAISRNAFEKTMIQIHCCGVDVGAPLVMMVIGPSTCWVAERTILLKNLHVYICAWLHRPRRPVVWNV